MIRIRLQLCAAAAFLMLLGLSVTPALACVKINGFKWVCYFVPGALDEIKMRVQRYTDQNSFLNAGAPAPDLTKNCVTIDDNKSCGLTSYQLNDLKSFVDQNKSIK